MYVYVLDILLTARIFTDTTPELFTTKGIMNKEHFDFI